VVESRLGLLSFFPPSPLSFPLLSPSPLLSLAQRLLETTFQLDIAAARE